MKLVERERFESFSAVNQNACQNDETENLNGANVYVRPASDVRDSGCDHAREDTHGSHHNSDHDDMEHNVSLAEDETNGSESDSVLSVRTSNCGDDTVRFSDEDRGLDWNPIARLVGHNAYTEFCVREQIRFLVDYHATITVNNSSDELIRLDERASKFTHVIAVPV